MPRSNRPRRSRADQRRLADPPRAVAPTRRESGPDGDWLVRPVPGSGALKAYRCPGCDQVVAPGTPHLVAWPDEGSVTDRRHWHSGCWAARYRRGPTSRRW